MKQSQQSGHVWSGEATLKLPAWPAKEPDVAGGIIAAQHLERINLPHRNSEVHKEVVRTAGWKCGFERKVPLKNIFKKNKSRSRFNCCIYWDCGEGI